MDEKGIEVATMKEKKSNFSNSLGFVLAAAGSAVGVGTSGVFPIYVRKTGADYFWWYI